MRTEKTFQQALQGILKERATEGCTDSFAAFSPRVH